MTQILDPRIASVTPAKIYDGADVLATMTDPETGETRTMMRWQWQERYDEYEAKKEAAYRAQQAPVANPITQAEELVKQQFSDLNAIPTEQTLVKGATACKSLWGENMLLCTVVNPHATRTRDSGLIIPEGNQQVEKMYLAFWEKSTIVRLDRISDRCNTKQYPAIKNARMRLALGLPGPILELKPGAGSPRKGVNGEACIIVHAQHVWMEFPADEPLTWRHRLKYLGLRLLSALAPWQTQNSGGA
jgi:hypothetical protein